MLNMYSGYYMFIGFVRTCNTIQLGYKYLISKIQSVSNIGKCLQVDTTTTVHPSTEKLLHVTFGIHKKQISLADIARSLVAPTSSRQMALHGKTPVALEQVLWRPVPKHPNSSRIRAHAKQNAARQNASRHLWNP